MRFGKQAEIPHRFSGKLFDELCCVCAVIKIEGAGLTQPKADIFRCVVGLDWLCCYRQIKNSTLWSHQIARQERTKQCARRRATDVAREERTAAFERISFITQWPHEAPCWVWPLLLAACYLLKPLSPLLSRHPLGKSIFLTFLHLTLPFYRWACKGTSRQPVIHAGLRPSCR